jgi:CheY-like chemotaxis protein
MMWRNRAFGMTAAPQPTAKAQARSTSRPPRVLIVEDELLVAWHLESLAREQNLEVCGLVPDGVGAIEQAVDLDVDLILMDIRLAGRMDGIEAARRIREQRDTPIIFVTAHGDAANRTHIERALPGAPVLVKPITAERLREAIAQVFKKKG